MEEDFEIQVKVLNESGFYEAMLGLSYNKNQPIENMPRLAKSLAFHDGGHNKFLEQIIIWLEVRAPRYVWQEMDTFRLSTKSSQSTMHTILDDKLTRDNFERKDVLDTSLHLCNVLLRQKELVRLKRALPEGFMQKRMWMMSYKTLRNIILQRKRHRLPHWPEFIRIVLREVLHSELLPSLEDIEGVK